ncbi:MAG: DUF4147 domain-containing protein [Pseudomonadota bacterium]
MRAEPRTDPRTHLARLWHIGVDAVRGDRCVATALRSEKPGRPDSIIAVGKAAGVMASAAYAQYGPDIPGLVVTKYGHLDGIALPPAAQTLEAAHPVPDARSLAAGAALIDRVSGMAAGSHLLFLVSGGASALAEAPIDGLTLADVTEDNTRLLSQGLDIHAMNQHRITRSKIKGGKLLSRFPGAQITVLAMSDVEGDDVGIIGSGLGLVPDSFGVKSSTHIVASNAIARAAIAKAAIDAGLQVQANFEPLYADIATAADRITAALTTPGLYIFGGEPTVILPDTPGRGGRNQALALLLAERLQGQPGITALVAGTDGTDGPTGDAGGFADHMLWGDGAADALARADAGTYLAAHDALFTCGPTGTNVMDIALVLVEPTP